MRTLRAPTRAYLLGALAVLAGCSDCGGDRPAPATAPAPVAPSAERPEEPTGPRADDFPDEGAPVPGPIADPLGFVMPSRASWELTRNDVGRDRFALHGVPVPVRSYCYTTIVDRVEIAALAYVYWFRARIEDSRELAARLDLEWVRDERQDGGARVTELHRDQEPSTLWAFATPSSGGSTAIVLCGDQPPEAVGYRVEDEDEDDEEPDDAEVQRALARVDDPARTICASVRRAEPRPSMLPEHDSTPR